ncbi:MAG: DNA-binding protein [Rhizobiales bacterium]|nr:DNA-binding protein [Hyphomicrobiales bacterium]
MSGNVVAYHETNRAVAAALREAASLLEQQTASQFRILAYLKAADAVEQYDDDIGEIAARGTGALEALPHIGPNLAAAIHELVTTGRWSQLERLRGALEPEAAFQTIPGIGPALARRIHDHLNVDTLQALEAAAHDGRLARVPGVGPRRAAIIRSTLAAMLARRRPMLAAGKQATAPAVDVLLDVDREYREKSRAGQLRLIAPKRFNPEDKAWLPILHTERERWHFTVLYSNTARAHELHKTNDWVVIFYSADHQPEGQCTVVSETAGPMKGHRVVRGREKECTALVASDPALVSHTVIGRT